jgi:hypothetical protein
VNIPVEIVALFLGGVVALQGWTLVEVVRLKVKVAVLTRRVFHGDEEEE